MKSAEDVMIPKYHKRNGWVLIPAFNEAGMISEVVQAVQKSGYSVLVVDDGSDDDTCERATQAGATVLRHIINLGQGAALETGMSWLRERDCDWVVHFDADGQHDASQIDDLLKQLGESDVVLGSRFLPGSEHPGMEKGRKMLLRMARLFQNLITGIHLSDAHCGLRALNKKALTEIRLKESGMAHATELIMEIGKHKLSVSEIPVRVLYTEYSQAKGQSGSNAIRILFHLIQRKIL